VRGALFAVSEYNNIAGAELDIFFETANKICEIKTEMKNFSFQFKNIMYFCPNFLEHGSRILRIN
jgi:uncharacterized protein YpmS